MLRPLKVYWNKMRVLSEQVWMYPDMILEHHSDVVQEEVKRTATLWAAHRKLG